MSSAGAAGAAARGRAPPRPKPSTHVVGSALGLDDDSTVGWPADLVDFDEAQIRERHPALAADVDEADDRDFALETADLMAKCAELVGDAATEMSETDVVQ